MSWIPVEIVNQSLGEPYNMQGDPPVGEVRVADGWTAWWKQGSRPSVLHRPEFCPFTDRQKVFSTSSTHRGGIYQRVAVEPGTRLMLVANGWYSSTKAGIALVVGIDPEGTVPEGFGYDVPGSVEWGVWQGETSNPRHPERTPVDHSVIAEAQSSFVTLYLRSECMWPGKDASAFWNNVRLFKEVAGPEPQPPGEDEILTLLRRIDENVQALVAAQASSRALDIGDLIGRPLGKGG